MFFQGIDTGDLPEPVDRFDPQIGGKTIHPVVDVAPVTGSGRDRPGAARLPRSSRSR